MGNDDRLIRIEDKIDRLVNTTTEIQIKMNDIENNVAINTRDLTEHKEGVIQNRKRIEALEKPAIAIATLKSITLYFAALISVIVGISTVLSKYGLI